MLSMGGWPLLELLRRVLREAGKLDEVRRQLGVPSNDKLDAAGPYAPTRVSKASSTACTSPRRRLRASGRTNIG